MSLLDFSQVFLVVWAIYFIRGLVYCYRLSPERRKDFLDFHCPDKKDRLYLPIIVANKGFLSLFYE